MFKKKQKTNNIQGVAKQEIYHDFNLQVNWTSWILKRSSTISSSALNTVDYLGESLANFFGITTPKYQFEINYHNNIMQEVSITKLNIKIFFA